MQAVRRIQNDGGLIQVAVRSFYSGLDENRINRLRRASILFNKPRGRDVMSLAFEKRIVLKELTHPDVLFDAPEVDTGVAVVDFVSLAAVREGQCPLPPFVAKHLAAASSSTHGVSSSSTSLTTAAESYHYYPAAALRHLRKDADSSRYRLPRVPSSSLATTSYKKDPAQSTPPWYLTLLLEPFIDVPVYRREEAHVELITAYRNVFYEFAEMESRVGILRCPAISVGTTQFSTEIAKMNQQSVIKGFHRVSAELKEVLMERPHFTVELYIPRPLLAQFQTVFLEDAWDTPESIISPGRVALYPGLAPPKQLLELDGWVGKRPELIAAIQSEGKSLNDTPKTLGGVEVEEVDAYSSVNVTASSSRAATKRMLELEAHTAKEQGFVAKEAQPLKPGLQHDDDNAPRSQDK